MKKLLITILLYVAFSCSSFANELFKSNDKNFTDTILPLLTSLNLGYYENKPIDTFMTALPTGYISVKVQSQGNLKHARILKITYPNKVRVVVYVKEFTHMNPRSETSTWDINLFRKEKVACIEIWEKNIRRNEMCDYWN